MDIGEFLVKCEGGVANLVYVHRISLTLNTKK
jgi:hypothetical protein